MIKNVEAGFIAKLVYSGDKKILTEERISPQLFNGIYQNAFKYITGYVSEHGDVPTKEVLIRYFPALDLPPKSKVFRTKLKWWVNELRRKAVHNELADMVEKIYEQLESKNPEKAKSILEQTVRSISLVSNKSKDLELTESFSVMKQEYARVENTGGMVGLPTGFSSLDRCLGGLDKEQFITIMGRLGTGKTWFLLLLLYNIWKAGFTVALGTKEMSVKQLIARLMSIHTGLSHEKIRKGQLSKQEKAKYIWSLMNLKKYKNKFYIFSVDGGVSYLRAKVEQFKPDILGVDGIYLMDDDEGGKGETERVTNISRSIKSLAQAVSIPVIGTTQANRATSKKTGPEVDNISYSDAVGQDSDIVLGLNQTEEMKNDREMEVRVLKTRDSYKIKLMLMWDFDVMKFDEIYSDLGKPEDKKVENSTKKSKKRKVA